VIENDDRNTDVHPVVKDESRSEWPFVVVMVTAIAGLVVVIWICAGVWERM
jgi:hypothetical protein